jgi:hypothetical protein
MFFLIQHFILDQNFSMGFKSGEYGGRKNKLTGGRFHQCFRFFRFVERCMVHHHHLAWFKFLNQELLYPGFPLNTMGAMTLLAYKASNNVCSLSILSALFSKERLFFFLPHSLSFHSFISIPLSSICTIF